jgi:hypothetical protein
MADKDSWWKDTAKDQKTDDKDMSWFKTHIFVISFLIFCCIFPPTILICHLCSLPSFYKEDMGFEPRRIQNDVNELKGFDPRYIEYDQVRNISNIISFHQLSLSAICVASLPSIKLIIELVL